MAITYHAGEGAFFYHSHNYQPPGQGSLGDTVEARFPDGTITRYENPNMQSMGGHRYFRPVESIDPYDNRTQWEYDSSGRVTRVYKPDGVDELWDYSPSWIGDPQVDPEVWPSTQYSGIEVRTVDRFSSPPDQDLNRTTRRLFIRRQNSQGHLVPGCRPFAGDLLYRIYYPASNSVDDLLDPFSASLVDVATDAPRHAVTEFAYQGSYVGETPYVESITRFTAASCLVNASTSVHQAIVTYEYVDVGGRLRVRTEVQHQTGRTYTFSYVEDRDSVLRVEMVSRYDQDGNERTWTLDDEERVTSVTLTPTNDVFGRPRSFDTDNGGLVEPTSITTNYTYSSCGACTGKPSVIEELPSGRRWEYDYDSMTGLLLQSREPNPSGSSTLATTTYEWEPAVAGVLHGAYTLKSVTYPDGRKWSYGYQSVARATPSGSTSWGIKHQKTWVDSPAVTVVGGGAAVPLHSEATFNTAHPTFANGRQTALVGQQIESIDGDGVTTAFAFNTVGALTHVTRSPGGGDAENITSVTLNRLGELLQSTSNDGSSLPRTTDFSYDGAGRIRTVATLVNGLQLEQQFYYDSLGNMVVHLTTNRSSDGSAPDDFGATPRPDTARQWIRNEYHYHGDRLVMELVDRRALDRDEDSQDPVADAADARFARQDYSWSPEGLLLEQGQTNGSVVKHVYDGYGILYKVTCEDGLGGSLLKGKFFVNNRLEIVRVVDGLGHATTMQRNLAGRVTRRVEPLSDPGSVVGYPWATIPQRAREYDRDAMGRLVEVREVEEGSTPAVFARRATDFDEVGRPYRVRVFEGSNSTASQEFSSTWEGASKEKRVTGPGGRFIARVFDARARLVQVQDSRASDPNQVTYFYLPKTDFVQRVVTEDYDENPAVDDYAARETEYLRDNLGRVLQIRHGPVGSQLVHTLSYYSTGQTQSYTDPLGKIELYLPDARGRLVERFRPQGDPIWNSSDYTDWASDGRTRLVQTDGRGRVTTSVYDFAGRMEVVMEPGATTEPTSLAPHQSFAKFMAFDAASRLTDIHTGNDGHLHLSYDGNGRMIMRQRVPVSSSSDPHISSLYGFDVVQRDVIGQILETRSGYGSGSLYLVEQFDRDSLGRTHRERFGYETTGLASNWIDVESKFSTSDPGDPIRVGLKYANGLASGTDDLWLEHLVDSAGRLGSIKWGTTSTTTDLAAYLHEGRAVRMRTTTFLVAPPSPAPASFDTTYEYDDYGRMVKISQSFSASAEVEFGYDSGSNLVREVYAKQDGTSVGDQFAYDEHNRLLKAWLGSNSAHMGATDPDGGVGSYIKRLTYGMDAANNRTDVETEAGSGGAVTTADYDTQDGGPQGPSNRYEAADGVKPWYDDRGNLIFDGLRYYIYDALNRLTEVYLVDSGSQQSQMMSQSQQAGSSMAVSGGGVSSGSAPSLGGAGTGEQVYEVNDISALEHARTLILGRVSGGLGELIVRQNEPGFASLISQELSPTVAHGVSSGTGGGGGTMSSSGTFASSSATAPDPASLSMTLIAVYLYDVHDRRVIRWLLYDRPYYYAWDGWQEAEELTLDVLGSAWVVRPVKQFVWGEQLDELVAYRYRSGQPGAWADYYIGEGGAHCPSYVLDVSGTVVEVQEYDAYGRTSFFDGAGQSVGDYSLKGNPFRWKGHRVDWETGLVYMRHRYYCCESGRFVTGDPLGVWADAYSYGSEYLYAACNPLSRHDPLGLQVVESVFSFIGTIVGGAAGAIASPVVGAVQALRGGNFVEGMGNSVATGADIGGAALGAVGGVADGAINPAIAALANVGEGVATLDPLQAWYGVNSAVSLPVTIPAGAVGALLGQASIGALKTPYGDWRVATTVMTGRPGAWGFSLPGLIMFEDCPPGHIWNNLTGHEGGHTWQVLAFTGPGYMAIGVLDLGLSGLAGTLVLLDPYVAGGWNVVP